MRVNYSAIAILIVALFSGFSISAQTSPDGLSSEQSVQQQTTVNINTATAEELSEVLIGVGPVKATAIVAWRDENGPFQHVDELVEVKGIGEKTVEKNSGKLSID